MATFTRNVSINSQDTDGKINDASWGSDPIQQPLSVGNGDTLAISVADSGSATQMTLFATISPNPVNGLANTAGSPFLRGGGNSVQTFFQLTLTQAPWVFGPFPAVSTPGKYELTYVIQTDNSNQFSEDPEFDVDP